MNITTCHTFHRCVRIHVRPCHVNLWSLGSTEYGANILLTNKNLGLKSMANSKRLIIQLLCLFRDWLIIYTVVILYGTLTDFTLTKKFMLENVFHVRVCMGTGFISRCCHWAWTAKIFYYESLALCSKMQFWTWVVSDEIHNDFYTNIQKLWHHTSAVPIPFLLTCNLCSHPGLLW